MAITGFDTWHTPTLQTQPPLWNKALQPHEFQPPGTTRKKELFRARVCSCLVDETSDETNTPVRWTTFQEPTSRQQKWTRERPRKSLGKVQGLGDLWQCSQLEGLTSFHPLSSTIPWVPWGARHGCPLYAQPHATLHSPSKVGGWATASVQQRLRPGKRLHSKAGLSKWWWRAAAAKRPLNLVEAMPLRYALALTYRKHISQARKKTKKIQKNDCRSHGWLPSQELGTNY